MNALFINTKECFFVLFCFFQTKTLAVCLTGCCILILYVFPQAIGSEIRFRLQQFVEERMQTTMVQKRCVP